MTDEEKDNPRAQPGMAVPQERCGKRVEYGDREKS
jgi:hypothetical protein